MAEYLILICNNDKTAKAYFIYCEGKTDALFVRHLKKLYLDRGTKHISIKGGTGGDHSTLIKEVEKNAQARSYDKKYILLDRNGKKQEELDTLIELMKKQGIS